MKPSAFLVTIAASSAAAGPLMKRALEVVVEIETVYVTVTIDPTATATEVPVSSTPEIDIQPPPIEPNPPAEAPEEDQPNVQPPPPPPPPPGSEPEPTPEPQPDPQPAPPPNPPSGGNPPEEDDDDNEGGGGGGGGGSSVQDVSLRNHNIHRANHSAPAFSWSQQHADYAAATGAKCRFEHDMNQGGGGYGQNLAYWGTSGDVGSAASYLGRAITEQWYNGEFDLFPAYGVASPPMSNFHAWGHFSQVLWAGSTSVGCHVELCRAGTMEPNMDVLFAVCNYFPPGNVGGQYDDNVFEPSGQPVFHAA